VTRGWRSLGATVGFALAVASCSSSATSAEDGAPSEAIPDHSQLTSEIRDLADTWYGTSDIGGVVAVVGLADDSVHSVAIGEGAPGQPADPSDVMRIGSITKTYISALVLRLADEGRLSLDDSVTTHLPDLGIADSITIRDLLGHTSGIADPDPELLISEFRADSGYRYGYDELIAFADIPDGIEVEPAGFAYANAGYHVLGGVIERVTGTDIATVLRDEILDTADLAHTFLVGFEGVPDPIIPGNVDLDGDGTEESLVDVPYLAIDTYSWTAGAIVTTPDDLVSFARSLFDGTLLSEEAIAEMTSIGTGPDAGYGLGIVDIGDGVWGHNGGAPGYQAIFAHDPDRGSTAAVFTNCPSCATTPDTWSLMEGLLAIATSHQ
jgi:D-alanyl-D-alanine carboxypeptidase